MKQVIVITGASSGFGALAARALARAGHTVYASMRETTGRNALQVKVIDRPSRSAGVDSTRAMALKLSYLEYGSGPALIILHGLFGSGRNWNTVAKTLATTHKVYTLDLRNHGNSPWAEAMSYYDLAEDVHGFIEERRLAPVAVLGHSMGGKTAMVLALEHGHLVDRLIVVDIAPVVYGSDLEYYLKAMQDVTLTGLKRRDEVEAQLRGKIEDAGIRLFLMQNLGHWFRLILMK